MSDKIIKYYISHACLALLTSNEFIQLKSELKLQVESTWVFDLGVRLRLQWTALNSLSLKSRLKSMLESTSVCDLTQVAVGVDFILRLDSWKNPCVQNDV